MSSLGTEPLSYLQLPPEDTHRQKAQGEGATFPSLAPLVRHLLTSNTWCWPKKKLKFVFVIRQLKAYGQEGKELKQHKMI